MEVLVVKLSLMSVLSQLNEFPLSNSISLRSRLMYFSSNAGFESRLSRFRYIKLLCAVFLFHYDLINTCNLLLLG